MFGALGVIDLSADGDREELTGHVFIGMRQRQEGQKHFLAEPHLLERMRRAGAVMQDRPVRQHDALGRPSRSRRVDDDGGPIRADVTGGLANGFRIFPAPLEYGRPFEQFGVHRLIGLELLHADDKSRAVGLMCGGKQVFRQFPGRDQGADRARIRQNVGMVGDKIGGVGGDGNRARRHDRELGNQPLGAVLRHQHHPVSFIDAKRFETAGECRYAAGDFGPTVRLVSAVFFRPQEGFVPMLLGLVEEHGHKIWPSVLGHRFLLVFCAPGWLLFYWLSRDDPKSVMIRPLPHPVSSLISVGKSTVHRTGRRRPEYEERHS